MAAELRNLAAILDVRSGDREPPTLVAAAPQPSPKWFRRVAALIAVAALATALWFAFVS